MVQTRVAALTVFMRSQVLQVTPHIVGLYPLYRDIDSLVVKVSNSVTFNLTSWTFGRAVLNSFNRFTQRESNLVIARFTWEARQTDSFNSMFNHFTTAFHICDTSLMFSLSDTVDPSSLLHDDVLCFDHHAS